MSLVYRFRYVFVGISILAFLVGWWLIALTKNDPRNFPSPLGAASAFVMIFSNERGLGTLFVQSLGATMISVFAGFALAAAVGIPVGILMGRYVVLDYALDPQVNIWYSLPAIAFVPLVMNFFGLSSSSTLLVAFLIALFSVVINVYTGVKNISKTVVETALSFGSSQRQLLTKIIIPEALPNTMLGLRLAATRALEGVIVAEIIFSAVGIGGMIFNATDNVQLGLAEALIIVIALISIGLNEGMKYLTRRVIFWKESAAMSRK